MPRPKKPGAPEPKRRSRNGCWPCKTRKVKCDETRPSCTSCQKLNETCDYSIRLNWEGRGKKKTEPASGFGQIQFEPGGATLGASDGEDLISIPSISSSFYEQQPAVRREQTGSNPPEHPRSRDGYILPTSALDAERYPNNMSAIDPTLMPLGFPDSIYGVLPEQQQSYERYRSSSPNKSNRARPSQPSGIAQMNDPIGLAVDSRFESTVMSSSAPRSGFLKTGSPASFSPFFNDNKPDTGAYTSGRESPSRSHKRARYESGDSSPPLSDMPPPSAPTPSTFSPFNNNEYQVYPANSSTPLTPASNNSDDGQRLYSARMISPKLNSPDLRRLSVNSLLSGPPGLHYASDPSHTPKSNPENQDWSIQYRDLYTDTTTYGVDRGIKDLDIGKNDDANAISGSSPLAVREHLDLVLNEDEAPVEFGFGTKLHSPAIEESGYYDKPVPICIPKLLEPLPDKLLENPMNLLYFHHFINHTAGALIPHNCSSNPFKLILPQMAVRDDNLLNLLLAYSASHRARLLRQPEPTTRIALWVQGIFSNLRTALDDPSEIISNVNLATAIMLASLEIISPKAFGVAVPWQQHLGTAREMIAARGGPLRMKTASRGDKVASFLWSWFAYLDVLGSLSGGKSSTLSSAWILDDDIEDENDYAIDCILGFTSKCIRLLAKIAELGRVCDFEKANTGEDASALWNPTGNTSTRAEGLIIDLKESLSRPAKPCTHLQSTGEAAYQWDSLEMAATNEAFHWAGLVHLHRRILGKSSTHPDVQSAVSEIFGALYKIRKGSSAEACLLFPMFTAGCDSRDEKQRTIILERVKSIERNGMMQIHQARTLMEKVWETGKPWETLAAGEFFG